MMRNAVRGAVAAALAAAVLAGCGEEKESTAAQSPSASAKPSPSRGGGSTAKATPSQAGGPAAKDGMVGAAGSACTLPASFDLAPKWKPKPVQVEADSPLAGLAKQGPFTMACEIDAKPAGNIGFLRAWTEDAKSGTPRAALEAYVGADKTASKATYKEIKAGALPAAEVEYETYSKLLDRSKRETALAVVTPKGTLVLHLGGWDSEEHDQMLPAYERAKTSMKAAS
ncbi:lipoprotein [Streptomyces violascens]|uniref:lipoprotein n=1 Tax=Streptomyces violascens TaxID=67381 RepID=UPI00365512AA